MGIIKAFSGSINGTFADQWKDIITAGQFDEHTVVMPGVNKRTNNGRGSNLYGSDGIITNGSKIYVPENTAAFIFDQSRIEEMITEPGGYEYRNGQDSVFDGGSISNAIFGQIKDRMGYGGISSDNKSVAFINLREIRDIKFGTKGPQTYNDLFYGTDLEIFAYGSFTVKITDPEVFIKNYVPANVSYYTFDDPKVRTQTLSEFLQSFNVALNSLSSQFRISQLPSQANNIAKEIYEDKDNVGSWEDRFGFKLIKVGIENIEFTEESKQLVNQYSANKMNVKAYDDVSKKSSDIAAQQKIAEGIKNNGFGDAGGMLFSMNFAKGLDSNVSDKPTMSFDEQIEALKKLKELMDAGILTQEEFDAKKKEVMGL